MGLWSCLVSIVHAIFSRFFAWRYDKHEEPPTITAKRRELVDTIPRNAHVLEIGAGTGATLTAGAYDGSAGRFARLVLTEPDAGMRARLHTKLPGRATGVAAGELEVVNAALPALPFPDASFDAVVMFFVASHLPGRDAAMAEVARVLKPRGQLLFMDHGAHPDHHHGHGHGHGHDHDHGHEQGAPSGDANGDADAGASGHQDHQGQPAAPKPFFYEWFRFMRRRRKRDDLSLDLVLKELRAEERMEETFETRMPVNYFFKEITYSCFVRRPDPDT